MENRNIKRFVHFSPDEVTRETVFETEHLWSQVLCLSVNQKVGPLEDPGADAMFLVVAGQGVFQVDTKRRRLDQWGTVLVPAGAAVTISNATGDPLVLLPVAAPPPAAREVSGG